MVSAGLKSLFESLFEKRSETRMPTAELSLRFGATTTVQRIDHDTGGETRRRRHEGDCAQAYARKALKYEAGIHQPEGRTPAVWWTMNHNAIKSEARVAFVPDTPPRKRGPTVPAV